MTLSLAIRRSLAQYALGRVYKDGEAVEQDRVRAFFWLMLGAGGYRERPVKELESLQKTRCGASYRRGNCGP